MSPLEKERKQKDTYTIQCLAVERAPLSVGMCGVSIIQREKRSLGLWRHLVKGIAGLWKKRMMMN